MPSGVASKTCAFNLLKQEVDLNSPMLRFHPELKLMRANKWTECLHDGLRSLSAHAYYVLVPAVCHLWRSTQPQSRPILSQHWETFLQITSVPGVFTGTPPSSKPILASSTAMAKASWSFMILSRVIVVMISSREKAQSKSGGKRKLIGRNLGRYCFWPDST